jgi:hypothetical protein
MTRLLIFWLFSPFFLLAQPSVTKTPTLRSSGKIYTVGLSKAGPKGNIYLAYMVDYSSWAVDIFSPDLKQITTGKPAKVKFPDESLAKSGSIVCLDGNTPQMLFYDHDKKEKTTAVYTAPLSKDGQIGTLKKLGLLKATSGDYATPNYFYSPDSAHLLLACVPTFMDPDEKVAVMILNKSMEVVQQGNLDFPRQDKELFLGQPIIHTDASVWMPVWGPGSEEGVTQEVWRWADAKSKPTMINVQVSSEKLITSMVLESTANGIFVGGLYADNDRNARKGLFKSDLSNYKDSSPEQGTFYVQIDPATNTVRAKSAHIFGEEVLKFWKKSTKEVQGGQGISWLRTRKVVPLSDGNVWISVEEAYTPPTTQRGTTGAMNTGGEPVSGPAIAVMHTADGSKTREVRIDKYNSASVERHIGHFFEASTTKGVLYLYHNSTKNLEKKATSRVFLWKNVVTYYNSGGFALKPKKSCVVAFRSDPSGKTSTDIAYKVVEANYWLEPNTYLKLAPDVFVFACEGNSDTYGLVKIRM